MTTDQILAQCDTIRELSEKATAGPWNPTNKFGESYEVQPAEIWLGECSSLPRGAAKANAALIAESRTFAPSAAQALKVTIEAIRTLEFEVGGRLPADSSDSITVEAIHIRRVLHALQQITEAF